MNFVHDVLSLQDACEEELIAAFICTFQLQGGEDP